MERLRRLGIPRSETSPEVKSTVAHSDVGTEAWERAYLGKSLSRDVYCATLALSADNSKEVYAFMIADPLRVSLDIPLVDHTPQDTLLQEASETTFFGKVVPKRYRAFATNEFTRHHLLAFLNRKKAGVLPDEVPEWFYTTFGVKHLEEYGSVYLHSHGGAGKYGQNHCATIERSSPADHVDDMTTRMAIDFAKVIQESLPHLSVEPLPVKAYLQDLQSTLQFLPVTFQSF